MRIVSETKGIEKEAYKLDGVAFKCFPRSSNLASTAKGFSTIEAAAKFLIENPGWGIRMNPGSAIIYDNISILLD